MREGRLPEPAAGACERQLHICWCSDRWKRPSDLVAIEREPAPLAHASKMDPYMNYVLKTDPHLAHVMRSFSAFDVFSARLKPGGK